MIELSQLQLIHLAKHHRLSVLLPFDPPVTPHVVGDITGYQWLCGCGHGHFWKPDTGKACLSDMLIECAPRKSGDVLAVGEEWQVWSWQPHALVIQFRDGYQRKAGRDALDDGGEFAQDMWIESGDDCEAAGWVLRETASGSVYEPPEGDPDGLADPPTRWRPASTLPEELARHHVRVESVKPVQVAEITEDEATLCGHAGQCSSRDGHPFARPSMQLEGAWSRDHDTPVDEAWAWMVEIVIQEPMTG